jgi:hypothetical protein
MAYATSQYSPRFLVGCGVGGDAVRFAANAG